MPLAPNFTSIFSKDWEINFTQCMPNGYLKYTDLCNMLQLTAASHSDMGGISFSDMQEFNQAWVLSKMRVEITELPKWRDIVTVKTWVNTLERRRPEALALPYEHIDLYPEKKPTQASFSKITINPEKEVVFEKVVYLSDLDIVNHVNNVKYLEWCLDHVDEKSILNEKLDSFEMNFMKELSLNDTVIIHENFSEESTIFSITKEDKTCFALQLNWK